MVRSFPLNCEAIAKELTKEVFLDQTELAPSREELLRSLQASPSILREKVVPGKRLTAPISFTMGG